MYQASCVNAILHNYSELSPSVWFTPFANWFFLCAGVVKALAALVRQLRQMQ